MEKGICIAGNVVLDILYPIERYPQKNELTTILEGIGRSTGGAMNNTIMGLASLDATLNLKAVGIVGEDAEGEYVIEQLKKYPNISLDSLQRKGRTSFTIVMQESSTKQRTFFHYRGANAILSESDFDLDKLDVDLLHIGYILLLDAMDLPDEEYGTKMARFLASVQARGIKTSVDVVSEAGDRFRQLVPPALKYTDYCIINELEAQEATGTPLRDENEVLITDNMKQVLSQMFDMGVSTWAVIHAPEGGYGMDAAGNYFALPSLKLPKGYIKGTVGAGDAFCAGVLYGAYKGKGLEESIKTGIASAASSLSEEDATQGMRPYAEVMENYERILNLEK